MVLRMRSDDVRFDNAARQVFSVDVEFGGTPEQVFPLLCPIREYDWIPDWTCEMIYSETGIAELGCLFRTGHAAGDEVWTVSHYDPNTAISFVRNRLNIWVVLMELTLQPAGSSTTTVTVTHTYTALSPEGETQIKAMNERQHATQWQTLAKLASHYVATGTIGA